MTCEVALADLLAVSAAGGCDDPLSQGNLGAERSGAAIVEQVVYSIYHMVLYFLPEGDGWVGCW